jgi:hypothetical protein
MALVWPGLDFLVKANISRGKNKAGTYSYPFSIYPLPSGKSRGTYQPYLMDQIVATWRQLKPKSSTGGRVQMNAVQVRASIFAIRVYLALCRRQKHNLRRSRAQWKGNKNANERAHLNAELKTFSSSIQELRVNSRRVLPILEKHMKRANRALLTTHGPEQVAAISTAWRGHLRWMRLHLAYFKPLSPIVKNLRARQRGTIDILVNMAEKGLQNEACKTPGEAELRHVMRLYARSARRGLQGRWTVPELVAHPNFFLSKWHLAEFVKHRLRLQPLEEK